MRRTFGFIAAVTWLAYMSGPAVWAASIVPVGVLSPDQAFSDLRALSPNGDYAVGGTRNAEGLMTPYLWTPSTGMIVLPAPYGYPGWATGVDIRPAVNQIVIAGQVRGNGYRYQASMAGEQIVGWTRLLGDPATSEYNSLAASTDGDRYFIAGYLPGSCTSKEKAYRYRGSTSLDDYWSLAPGSNGDTRMESVAATGAIVGHDANGLVGRAPTWTSPPNSFSTFPSDEPWENALGIGISNNGMWFTGAASRDGQTRPFRWARDGASSQWLELPAGALGAYGIDICDQGLVIGTAGWADGSRQAILWDDTGLWGSSGPPVSVAQRLEEMGVDLNDWAALTSVNSISSDGRVIAGDGIWAADGSTRAWVATLPEPNLAVLLLAGAWVALGRRRKP